MTQQITLTGTLPAYLRSSFTAETGHYTIPWTEFRVHDAFQTNLPGTPLTEDLGLVGGTFGTDSPSIQTEDLKAAGATNNYARFTFQLPVEYVSAGLVTVRCHAGMLTTTADNTATLDVECYKSDKEAGIGSDLCTTAALTINSLTLGTKDFTIDPTGLAAGDTLDIRLTTAVNDAANATVVKAIIGQVAVRCDIKG